MSHFSADSLLWAICTGVFAIVIGLAGYLVKRTYERIEKRIDALEELSHNLNKEVSREFGVIHSELKLCQYLASSRRSSDSSD